MWRKIFLLFAVNVSLLGAQEISEATNHQSLESELLSVQEITNTSSVISSNDSKKENFFAHMLGIHFGVASGVGLCYRHYVDSFWSWQISFLPYYDGNEGVFLAGFLSQFFLSSFSAPYISFEGNFFGWFGGLVGYAMFPEGDDYAIQIGGGIGFETFFLQNFIWDVGVGYYGRKTKKTFIINPLYFTYEEVFSSFTIAFETTVGYRF